MTMRKTVLVVFGGVSSEHEISLCSAANIITGLDRTRYDLRMLGIRKSGEMLLYEGPTTDLPSGNWEKHPSCRPCVISPCPTHHGLLLLENGVQIIPVDCVIPVLHGKNGEDGTIQGLLELAQIPYVGCGVLASASCLDKEVTYIRLTQAGIAMAKSLCVRKNHIPSDFAVQVSAELGFPVFVKPACAGSSVGVSKVSAPSELLPAMEVSFLHDYKLLVQEEIVGREIEMAMLVPEHGNDAQAVASIPGQILSNGDFYDYQTKYQGDGSPMCIPAKISKGATRHLQQVAEKAFLLMECRGLARVDFFLTENEQLILNEINTFPGFTFMSMYPALWENMGISLSALLERLIEQAIDQKQ